MGVGAARKKEVQLHSYLNVRRNHRQISRTIKIFLKHRGCGLSARSSGQRDIHFRIN